MDTSLTFPWRLPGASGRVAAVTIFLAASSHAAGPDAAHLAFFEGKIRPVLAEQCYRCHSLEADQKNKLKAGLFLDSQEGVRRGGDSGPAVVPGEPEESLLIKAIRHEDDLEMPPKKPKLSDAVIADFVKWVKMGAPDPRAGASAQGKHGISVDEGRSHWAFQPLAAPRVPAMQSPAAGWADSANVIDRFILAAQQARGVTPAPLASKEKLARRLFFDLAGLPPTEAEMQAFLADTAADAYPKLVDRLLDSPRYAERWARHWLDLVRFAESGGYEFDRDRPGAYHYRDWVIKALNEDMPYDEFVRLQIAGDKLKPNDYLAGSATGFLVAGPFPGQLTSKTKEPIRYDQLDDMIDTLGQSMLGLSLGCARCHTHKFDPIPHQDYYAMLASLGRTGAITANLDPNPQLHEQARREWAVEHKPFADVLNRFLEKEFPKRVADWQRTSATKPEAKPSPARWQWLDWTEVSGESVKLEKHPDGLVTASASPFKPFILTGQTRQTGITNFLLDLPADRSLKMGGPGMFTDGGFELREIKITASPLDPKAEESPVRARLRVIAVSSEDPSKPGSDAVDDNDTTPWGVAGQGGKSQFMIVAVEDAPLGFAGGTKLEVRLLFANNRAAARMRVAFHVAQPAELPPVAKGPAPALPAAEGPVAEAPAREPSTGPAPGTENEADVWIASVNGSSVMQNAAETQALLQRDGGPTLANRLELARWLRVYDDRVDAALALTEAHERLAPQPAYQKVFAAGINDLNIGPVQWLALGDVSRKQGRVAPGFLQVLNRSPIEQNPWLRPNEDSRVSLARWLTDATAGAGNLLARVQANRLWHYHFGRGLVGTPNDFGFQGDKPTHPDLLEWLAAELVRGNWQLKPMHRLIVTSAVYRQAAQESESNQRLDPDNTLWWRRPSRRLEAETLRDSLLLVSGRLDERRFGPGSLDEQKTARRSIYLTVKRSQPISFLQIFDAPEGIQSQGNRAANTMPTQALTLMNSPWVRNLAVELAQRIRKEIGPEAPPRAALEKLYRLTLSRDITARELRQIGAFMEKQQALLEPSADREERALQEACLLVLSCNEFLYVD